MGAVKDLKAKHIAAADKRWDDAIHSAQRFLCYDRSKKYGDEFATPEIAAHDVLVRKVAHRLFTVSNGTRYSAFGGVEDFGIKMHGYGGYVPHCAADLLEFVRFFVGHELVDDGCPGVGYYRSTRGDKDRRNSKSYVRCSKDHPKAQPYFHRDTDVLRDEGYDEDPEGLCEQRALEVLDWYEDRRAGMARKLQNLKDKNGTEGPFAFHWSDENIAGYRELSDKDQALADLADEIVAMGWVED